MEENSTPPPPESRERSCFPFAFCTVPFAICTVPFAISTVLDRADGARRDLKKKFSPPPLAPAWAFEKKNRTVQNANGTVQMRTGPFKRRTGPYRLRTGPYRMRTESNFFHDFQGGGSDRFFPHNSLLGGVKSII